jgi:hypothetical protein
VIADAYDHMRSLRVAASQEDVAEVARLIRRGRVVTGGTAIRRCACQPATWSAVDDDKEAVR